MSFWENMTQRQQPDKAMPAQKQNVNQQNDPMLESTLMNQPVFDKGGAVPQINLHDGKHRMIVAEEGERVLTPQQNREYEATHPDARKQPMMAEVHDCGGMVYDKGGSIIGGTNENVYDKGGAVPAPAQDDSMWGRIKNRAQELYDQAKSYVPTVQQPMSGIAAKQQQVDEYKAATTPARPQMQQPYEAAPSDRVNPQARYGDKPGEVRPEQMKPVYDDGGMVDKNDQEKASDDAAAKDAAMRQATQEVHMEEAPISHGTGADRMEARSNLKPVRMQYDTENPIDESKGVSSAGNMSGAEPKVQNAPLTPPKMDMRNTPAVSPTEQGPTVQEASTISTPHPTQMNAPTEPTPVEPTSPKPEDIASDMETVNQDKLAAMKKGTAGLSDLGTSIIHERLLKAAMPELAPETPAMPKYTGTERIGKGTPGEAEAHKQFEDKRHDYDTRIQAAMDQGTPEGDREAASLQLAKQHFEKMNPFGSAANRPGIMGKIEHGLAKAGNIAGNLVAAPEMSLIPGTELNKKAQAQQFRGQEQEATKESLEQAQARQANIGSKLPPPTQVFDDLKGQINPETGKVYTDQERLDVAQNPGKAGEVTYARKYMKDHPGSTYEDGAADYHRMVAGTKPLNEQERKIADYLSAQKMEDTPQNRDAARVALERRDTLVKQQTELPFAEAKAKFNDTLSTARALLVQQNADANQRGLKADELQQVENARSSAVSSKLQTAKDALNATDEQFSNQIVPIVSLLAVTSAEGVKRVNKQELDKFVPTSGSLGRWISGHSDQFLSGQIPAEYRAEVGHMLDRMTAAEVAEHIINTRSIDGTIRQGAQQPVQKPEGGAAAKPAASKPQAPAAEKPAGTTSGFADWKNKQQQNQPK